VPRPPIPQLKAELFKAMSHPARIRVLEVLAEGERSVGELVEIVGLEPSHLSQQLGVLRRAGLVATRKEGPSVHYSLADRRISRLLELAKQILLTYLTAARDVLTETDRGGAR
jgi:ArsR family transcriptional regulator